MYASVMGQRFRLAVLAAATGLSEERVRAVLEKASVLQFVMCEDGESDWYAFRHALIRDIAYEEFIGNRVRPIHRLIARALERCADAKHVPIDDLAYHSWAAGDAERCVRYNELAGDRAAGAFANHDARIYYARAREFADPNSEHYRRLTGKLVRLQQDG